MSDRSGYPPDTNFDESMPLMHPVLSFLQGSQRNLITSMLRLQTQKGRNKLQVVFYPVIKSGSRHPKGKTRQAGLIRDPHCKVVFGRRKLRTAVVVIMSRSMLSEILIVRK